MRVRSENPINSVRHALKFLGHEAPQIQDLDLLWAWVVDYWDIARVPGRKTNYLEEIGRI